MPHAFRACDTIVTYKSCLESLLKIDTVNLTTRRFTWRIRIAEYAFLFEAGILGTILVDWLLF
jgi:hypothetical protein